LANRTLYTMFQETVQKHGDRNAVGFRANKESEFTYWTYAQYAEKVKAFRRGLDALGLRKGDRIALISHENRVEWAITDLAAQSLGLVTVPIYGTLPTPQVAFYIKDSGARAIVVSDAKQRKKVADFRADTPTLEFVISMDGTPAELEPEQVIAFEEVSRLGEMKGRSQAELDTAAASVMADDMATLIYTSGTTGDPKGAMLSHTNMLQTPDGVMDEPVAPLGPDDIFLSFLPLSHITERVGGHFIPLRAGACIVYSLGLSSFVDEFTTAVRPTAIICVPRLWENIYEKAQSKITKLPERDRKIAQWGVEIGKECVRRRLAGDTIGPILIMKHMVAEKLVLAKLREQTTGGRLRYCVSGGAPLDREIAEFFLGIGIQILEGYGLSETNIIAINRPDRQRIGTVGLLMPKVEVKFAADGEILMRGQGQMQGYYNKPEATAEAIDDEGWFHTGDIGDISSDGYIRITDRKKDLIVLTNGKKVAPQPIEALLKHSPFIGEAVLFGDKQSTVMALLVPAFDKLLAWAKEQNLPTHDTEALIATPEALKLFKAEIDANTTDLADFEKIKRFKLVPKPFSIDGGELTPTLKVKRKVVAQNYAELIASMARG